MLDINDNVSFEMLLEHVELQAVFPVTKKPINTPTQDINLLDATLQEYPQARLGVHIRPSRFCGLIIYDEKLAKKNNFEEDWYKNAPFIPISDGNLYVFGPFNTKSEKNGLYELLCEESKEVFGHLYLEETTLLLEDNVTLDLKSNLSTLPELPKELPNSPCLHKKRAETVITAGMKSEQTTQLISQLAFQCLWGYLTVEQAYQELALQDETAQSKLDTTLKHLYAQTQWKLPPQETNLSEKMVQGTFDKLKEKAFEGFTQYMDNNGKRMKFAMSIITELAQSPFISTVEQRLLIKFISTQSHLGLNQTEIHKQVQEERYQHYVGKFPDPIFDVLTLQMKTEFLTSPQRKLSQLLVWDGSVFRPEPLINLNKRVNLYVNFLMQRVTNSTLALGIMRQKQSISSVVDQYPVMVDNPKDCVNLLDGILYPDGSYTPHDSQLGFDHKHPLLIEEVLNTKVQAPKFFQFLKQIWNDPDKETALQEAMGVTLFGCSTTYQRAFLLYGVPSSGKTQLLNIVKSLVPQNKIASIAPEKWVYKHNRTTMNGPLINLCGELSEKDTIKSYYFKSLIDGSEVFTSKDGVVRHPTTSHWFASNHLPASSDTSKGFARRWLILEFNKPVAEKNLILDVGDKLVIEEGRQILTWAIQGRLKMQGGAEYTIPKGHGRLILSIHNKQNIFSAFLHDSGWLDYVWSEQDFEQIQALPEAQRIERLFQEPYVPLVDLVLKARLWAKEQGRAKEAPHLLSTDAAEQCLGELAADLHIIKAKTDVGVVVFGLKLSGRFSLAGAEINRKGYRAGEPSSERVCPSDSRPTVHPPVVHKVGFGPNDTPRVLPGGYRLRRSGADK